MALSPNPIPAPQTFIELIANAGEWFVRIVENDQETVTTFDDERFAMVFAQEERLRLGVKEVTRV